MPLGTSSGRPTRARHVSAFAVELERSWILVDCGDGTQHQVLRSPLSDARLDAILLTHLHGDHALGLPGLLSSMGLEGRSRPLRLVGPLGIRDWLDATVRLPLLHIEFELEIIELGKHEFADEPVMVTEVAAYRVEALPLEHRVPCFGFRISEPVHDPRLLVDVARWLGVAEGPDLGRLQRGETVTLEGRTVTPDEVLGEPRPSRSVAVFGDTMPCANGVRLARDVDLLVHEATYDIAHADLAEKWMHSTSEQAATVARDAGASRLLITHFSSRHVDSAPLVEEARRIFPATDAAVELEWVAI